MNSSKYFPTLIGIGVVFFTSLVFSTHCISQPLSADDELKLLVKCSKDAKEELIEKKQFVGTLDSFVWGDLFHGEVHGKNGELESFVVGYDDSCFLAQHKSELLEIKYNLMCQSLPDHAGYVPVNVITQVKTKSGDFKSWLKQTGGSNEKCEKLVEKYTRQN